MDWIVELGAFIWLMYLCGHCMVAPVKSNCWLRLTRNVVLDAEMMTHGGDSTGHWRCPACFGKWTWGVCGCKRLIVIGESSTANGFKPGYRFAFTGVLKPATENKIAMMRSAKALSMIAGKKVNKEAILQAIAMANEEVNLKFSQGMREVKVYVAKRPEQWEIDATGARLTCEDPRLSIRSWGTRYLGVDVSDKSIQTIDEELFNDFLDVASGALDLEGMAFDGPVSRKLAWDVQQSVGFKRTRVLMAQLCG